jgi:hypothetical protein
MEPRCRKESKIFLASVRNRTHGRAVGGEVPTRRRKMMWLALTAITLAAAIGFNVLALAIERSDR